MFNDPVKRRPFHHGRRFFKECQPKVHGLMITSYAQNFEDVMLWRALGHIERGFYIDIGAQDPRVDSVSLLFYEHGWRGIHVEPTPFYADALRSHRPDETIVQAAVTNKQGVLQFYEIPGTGISTADPDIAAEHRGRGYDAHEIVVPCTTLDSIFELTEGRDIHWLKIDVEGFERQVLEGWGNSTIKPWIVVVESTFPMTKIERHGEWESILTQLGYNSVYFDGLNRFYVSESRRELEQAFRTPPNVFDDATMSGESNAPFHRLIVERGRVALDAAQAALRQIEQESQARIRSLSEELDTLGKCRAEEERCALEKMLTVERAFREQEQQWAARDRERSGELASFRTKLEAALEDAVLREQDTQRQLLYVSDKTNAALAEQARKHAEREREWQGALVEREREWQGILVAREREWCATLAESQSRIDEAAQAIEDERLSHVELLRRQGEQAEEKLRQQAFLFRKDAEGERARLVAMYGAELAELQRMLSEERGRHHERERELQRQAQIAIGQAKEDNTRLADSHALALAVLHREHTEERDAQQAIVAGLRAEHKALLAAHEVVVFDLEREKTALTQRYETLLREAEAQRIRHEQQYASDLSFLRSQIDSRNTEYDALMSKYAAQVSAHASQARVLAERNAKYLWEGYRLGRAEKARGLFAKALSFLGNEPKIDVRYFVPSIDEQLEMASAEHRMGRMKMLKINFQPEFIVRSDGKYSLDDFLSLHDRNFVRAAYLALLKREPDEYGEQHYLSRVRAGVSKILILADIQKSKEAHRHGVKVAHLKGAVIANKLFSVPVIGAIVQGMFFFFGVGRHLKDLRALENHLVRMGAEMQQHYEGRRGAAIDFRGMDDEK